MSEYKNLANCLPVEFLKQTNRIKKSVEKWMKVTEMSEIRKRIPDLRGIEDKNERIELVRKKAMENLSLILDNALEKHPEETMEVIALCCFVEPENINDHPMSFYMKSVAEMIGDEGVLSFFISLSKLGQMNILSVSKASE